MASNNYFINLPATSYAGFSAVNIMTHPKIVEFFGQAEQYLYLYGVQHNERADMIAYNLYGSASLAWVIYLVNGIIDPYYDWVLSEEDFNSMIVGKYGSVDKANKKILYWVNNWYENNNQRLIIES